MVVATSTAVPRFCRGQSVRFVGGEGAIQGYQPASGTWVYEIAMDLGSEPLFGRIGCETTILLIEADLQVIDYSSGC